MAKLQDLLYEELPCDKHTQHLSKSAAFIPQSTAKLNNNNPPIRKPLQNLQSHPRAEHKHRKRSL